MDTNIQNNHNLIKSNLRKNRPLVNGHRPRNVEVLFGVLILSEKIATKNHRIETQIWPSIVDQNFDFWPEFRFLTKFLKILGHKSKFWKIHFLTKLWNWIYSDPSHNPPLSSIWPNNPSSHPGWLNPLFGQKSICPIG